MAGRGRQTTRGARRRRRPKATPLPWWLIAIEVAAAAIASWVAIVLLLGRATPLITGRLLLFTGIILAMTVAWGVLAFGWVVARGRLRAVWPPLPALIAALIATGAVAGAQHPQFMSGAATLRRFVGARPQAHREAIAHQVYATYRRTDLDGQRTIIARAEPFTGAVHEAAAAFRLDPELLLGVGATESSFMPRDSRDGGRGIFQITTVPEAATEAARRGLGVDRVDVGDPRHNAFLAAATLRRYLDQMRGDPFLGLLAYNIGPRNGGLETIMRQYGATDFPTIQPYLQHLPRDYPIRVLTAALSFRVFRTHGTLPRYEDGPNARHIQQLGIPGLDGLAS